LIAPEGLDGVRQPFSLAQGFGEPHSHLDSDKQIFIGDGEHCWIVWVTDIMLLESEGNYTRVHFGSNRAMLYRSLRSIQERLDPVVFFRANRRHIINLRYVRKIVPWVNGGFLVCLASGSEVEISRRQAQLLRHQMVL
jgi:two-component system LytT family response regulator